GGPFPPGVATYSHHYVVVRNAWRAGKKAAPRHQGCRGAARVGGYRRLVRVTVLRWVVVLEPLPVRVVVEYRRVTVVDPPKEPAPCRWIEVCGWWTTTTDGPGST